MKTRSSIFRKAFGFFLLVALTLGACTSVLAISGTTTLTTKVPSHFTIDVYITGNGAVTVNGAELSQSGKVQAERNKEVSVRIAARNNCFLKSATYNGIDFTQDAEEGCISFTALEEDAVLNVTFATKPVMQPTGDNLLCPTLWWVIAFLCLVVIIFVLISRKRTNKEN